MDPLHDPLCDTNLSQLKATHRDTSFDKFILQKSQFSFKLPAPYLKIELEQTKKEYCMPYLLPSLSSLHNFCVTSNIRNRQQETILYFYSQTVQLILCTFTVGNSYVEDLVTPTIKIHFDLIGTSNC